MFVNDLIRKAEFKGISLWSSSQLFLDFLVFISLWLDHWQINTSLDKLLDLECGHKTALGAWCTDENETRLQQDCLQGKVQVRRDFQLSTTARKSEFV